ncbi:peptidyl-prolyl cis-trans isomerase-like 4 [Sycon ciliatum]|uniref:peptidyl-prolyl cis-trans isomerase-like 4 n=1 Tax=Sycon ciliatum TaxID=27933 RepID=UPI0020A90E97|eukprot:scpid37490/ scgid26014/ Peptidyl-prolyl cis-trans isomerase-like 4; Cyclophilin-like protein PPIL4; Rotamase PPIL4
MAVLLETSVGDIVVDLMLEERPKACLNFLKLCKMKYYNYCLFHTVKANFVAQAGDPSNTGDGGTSIWGLRDGDSQRFFAAEKTPRIKHTNIGCLSMVNDGNGRHSSQWFISLGAELDYLDAQEHTVFGAVSEGMDALQKLNEAYCDKEGRPYRDIRINHTVVLDDPYPDLDGLHIPSRSPSPSAEQLKSSRIGADEDLDDNQGLTAEEIEEKIAEQETAAHTTVLEMVGDIPDADAKPPDNVLFVCKLNAATTSEDLETIFSRFGTILSCEVIRDKKSGESLQYAFVEFERPEDCEDAYFKMDNVLIDERRIHVDFSQSVAKVKGGVNSLTAGKNKPEFKLKNRDRRGNDKYKMVFDDLDTAALVAEDLSSAKQSRKSHKKHDHSEGDSRKSSRWDSKDRHRSRSPHDAKNESRHHRAEEDRHHRAPGSSSSHSASSSGRSERQRDDTSRHRHSDKDYDRHRSRDGEDHHGDSHRHRGSDDRDHHRHGNSSHSRDERYRDRGADSHRRHR